MPTTARVFVHSFDQYKIRPKILHPKAKPILEEHISPTGINGHFTTSIYKIHNHAKNPLPIRWKRC